MDTQQRLTEEDVKRMVEEAIEEEENGPPLVGRVQDENKQESTE